MGKLIGYRLSDPKGEGCFHDPQLGLFVRYNQMVPISAIEGKSIVGTITDKWIRDGGLLPVYEEGKGEAKASPVSDKPDYAVMSKAELMKLASQSYEASSLKGYTKENLIALLKGE